MILNNRYETAAADHVGTRIKRRLQNLWSSRHLVFSIVVRQFQVRYRQSFIGFLWAFIMPLATLAAGVIVFKGMANVDTGGQSYELLTLAALIPWTFFSSGLSSGVGSVLGGKSLVTKVNIPRYALPLSTVGSAFLDTAISSTLFVALAYALGDGLPPTALWVPFLMLIEAGLIVGLVLLTSAAAVFARDIQLGISLLLRLWLLVTPVLYPPDSLPVELGTWYNLNPLTGLVETFQRVLIDGHAPDFVVLIPALVWTVISLLVGCWYFAATEKRFADVI